MLKVFINAWWIAVTISHNKDMECLNNPTPEAVYATVEWRERLKKLKSWSVKRWGAGRVGKLIHDREYGKGDGA